MNKKKNLTKKNWKNLKKNKIIKIIHINSEKEKKQ